MPKRTARKISGDPILQDCNITSASNIDHEVSYPSDTTIENNMDNYEVLKQSPLCSKMHKLDEECRVTESSEKQFKIPFSRKGVRNCGPNLFDSINFDESKTTTPEMSTVSEPFKRKCPGKDISFSMSSSDDSIRNNSSAKREPKFLRKKLTRSNACNKNNIFDSDLDESINKSKLASCDDNNSFQVQTRKSTIANYKSKASSVYNHDIFLSDLESSDLTVNMSNLYNKMKSVEEENCTSYENITKRKNSYLPKFLTKQKNTVRQDLADNTFDSIIFNESNESNNIICSESNTGLQSPPSRRESPLMEQHISADDETNNLSSCKLPQLPSVETKQKPYEVNEDIFQSDLETSDISLHCTPHTTHSNIPNNSSNNESPQLTFSKEKNNLGDVNSRIFSSVQESSCSSLQYMHNDESQCNRIENEKEVNNADILKEGNIADLSMLKDKALSTLLADDKSESPGINTSSNEGIIDICSKSQSTALLINEEEPVNELFSSVESSRALSFVHLNTTQEFAPSDPIVEGTLRCDDFPTQVSGKLSSDKILSLDVNQEANGSTKNSQGSGPSLNKKGEVNADIDRNENGNNIITETRNITVSNSFGTFSLVDISMSAGIVKSIKSPKRSLCKRVSFKIDDKNLDRTTAASDSSAQQVENYLSTSLDPLVYEGSSEGLNPDSVYIDIHASRIRNSGSTLNSNSENQLVNSINRGVSFENDDPSENIQSTDHSSIDKSECDHEDEDIVSTNIEDIDDSEDNNRENISTGYEDNGNSTQNNDMSDDDTEDNKENYSGYEDKEGYFNNNRLSDTGDESIILHSDISVERSFECGNKQSELSPRKNVYKEYESFLRNVHDNENPFSHMAQAVRQRRTNTILFKKPLPKKSSKGRTKAILDNVPFSELKTKKRCALEANREQTLHNEIEESLRKRKKQPIVTKLNNGKLKKPRRWVSSSMYEFIINKLKPKYGVNSRVQAEKLVVYLVGQVDKVLKIQDLSFYSVVEEMKLKLASLRVIQTHFDFREFIMRHFDAPFSHKVYPFGGEVSNPFEPENIFEEIPIDD